MDIFEHIKKEHQEVDQMLQKLSKGESGATETFNKLKTAVTAHIQAEEESLYPAMRESDSRMVEEAIREHKQASDVVDKIDRGAKSGDTFMQDIDNLTNLIQTHVEKEESQMLPRAREMFDQDRVKELSQKFDEVDDRIMQKSR